MKDIVEKVLICKQVLLSPEYKNSGILSNGKDCCLCKIENVKRKVCWNSSSWRDVFMLFDSRFLVLDFWKVCGLSGEFISFRLLQDSLPRNLILMNESSEDSDDGRWMQNLVWVFCEYSSFGYGFKVHFINNFSQSANSNMRISSKLTVSLANSLEILKIEKIRILCWNNCTHFRVLWASCCYL